MTLTAGDRLGPYQVVARLGAGGMGEVYRATDTRLQRSVAIKVLRPGLASNAAHRARFDREARAISALSHPHICTIHDVGHANGLDFLVMEYLEGETLAARLARRRLTLDEALRYAVEIAAALDAAHRRGLVHRDVKPSNIMLTSAGSKLLDFGVARWRAAEQRAAVSGAATAVEGDGPSTADGSIVGTPDYMAPEQLEGKDADFHADIFAFGAVLYEMATGRRAFEGSSRAAIIAAVLRSEPPPIAALAPGVPAGVETIVRTCLAKDPDDRWQSAADVRLQLLQVISATGRGGASRLPARRWRAAAWTAGAAVLCVGVAAIWNMRPARPSSFELRSSVAPPEGTIVDSIQTLQIGTSHAVSPDGRRLAFVARSKEGTRLWLRDLSGAQGRPLAGTEDAVSPFWAPAARSVGFVVHGELKAVAIDGGPARTICRARVETVPAWGTDGTILFASLVPDGGLYRVSADGGEPVALTTPNAAGGEVLHGWPTFLPDGRRFLFVAFLRGPEGLRHELRAGSLDGGPVRSLGPIDSRVEFVPWGALVHVRRGTLVAHPFDVTSLRFRGDSVALTDRVEYIRTTANASFSASSEVVTYREARGRSQLTWFDRSGRETGIVGAPAAFDAIRISPDGQRVAAGAIDGETGNSRMWVIDLLRNVSIRLGSGTTDDRLPVWSPDGRELLYRSDRRGPPAPWIRAADGTGTERMLFPMPDGQRPQNALPTDPNDWSSRSGSITYTVWSRETGADVWVFDPATRVSNRLFSSRANERDARFSADGRWIVFVSDELGTAEVFLAKSDGTQRVRVSTGGGTSPRWRRDSRELFFVAGDGRLIAVPVAPGATHPIGTPASLFRLRSAGWDRDAGLHYDVAPDGQRFLITMPLDAPHGDGIELWVGWQHRLRQMFPLAER